MNERDNRLRVFVVEDSKVLVKRIVEWFESDPSLQVVGTADAMVLSAGQVREACAAIDEAVTSLKRLLDAAVAEGGGPAAAASEPPG